jgi:hypothetical protein
MPDGDVLPALHHYRVRALVQRTVEPRCHLVVSAGAGHPGSKRNLLLDVLECGWSVEFTRGPGPLPTREDRND